MTETQLQIAVIKELRARGHWAIHIPNEAKRSKREAAIAKQKGVQAGAPDVICWNSGVAIELKLPGETLPRSQELYLAALKCLGWVTGVAHSVEEAVAIAERRERT